MNYKKLSQLLSVFVVLLVGVTGVLVFDKFSGKSKISQFPEPDSRTEVSFGRAEELPVEVDREKSTDQAKPEPKDDAKVFEKISQTAKGYEYTNSEFGFSITFPTSWEGLTTRRVGRADAYRYGDTIIYFQVPASECAGTPNPATGNCYVSPFAVSVNPSYTGAKIGTTREENPSILSSNSKFIFVGTPWQDPARGMESIDFGYESLRNSFRLK